MVTSVHSGKPRSQLMLTLARAQKSAPLFVVLDYLYHKEKTT
jgi:hypothetical protein